jgi:dihydroorotate dehydrogenase (fumarate)
MNASFTDTIAPLPAAADPSARGDSRAMRTDTSYLGLRLPHPFVAGASPLGYRLDSIKRLEDAGAAAVVLHSLFEEQITATTEGRLAHADRFDPEFADVLAEFPPSSDYPLSPDGYAEHVYQVTRAVGIPVIGSLNGSTAESWLKFARVIEQAGAAALELNVYDVVTDLDASSAAVESRIVGIVKDLKRVLRIPVAVKLSPYYTAFAHLAQQLDRAGADGLVMFNRFYQADIDIRTMQLTPQADLSTSAELLLRLRWLAILYGRVRSSLAVTGGVAVPADGIKAILAGADVVQLVSAILRHGPAYVNTMLQGLEHWLEWNKVASLDEMRGRASLERSPDPAALERAHYIRTLHSWTK